VTSVTLGPTTLLPGSCPPPDAPHLHRYAAEFDFRDSNRSMNSVDDFGVVRLRLGMWSVSVLVMIELISRHKRKDDEMSQQLTFSVTDSTTYVMIHCVGYAGTTPCQSALSGFGGVRYGCPNG